MIPGDNTLIPDDSDSIIMNLELLNRVAHSYLLGTDTLVVTISASNDDRLQYYYLTNRLLIADTAIGDIDNLSVIHATREGMYLIKIHHLD